MELFDDNSALVSVLPSLVPGLLVLQLNYKAIAALTGEESPILHSFMALVPRAYNAVTVDQAKNLQLTLLLGECYVKALSMVLQHAIVDLGRGLFKVSTVTVASPATALELVLAHNNVFLENGELISLTPEKDTLPVLSETDVLVDLVNWYCACSEFHASCSQEFQDSINYHKINFITKLLNSCPTRLHKKLPICCHLLAVLIVVGNKSVYLQAHSEGSKSTFSPT